MAKKVEEKKSAKTASQEQPSPVAPEQAITPQPTNVQPQQVPQQEPQQQTPAAPQPQPQPFYVDQASKQAELIQQAEDAKAAAQEQYDADVAKVYDDYAKQTEEANKVNQASFADIMAQILKEQEAAKEEDRIRRQMETRKNLFGAATEVATALVNMIGVGSFNSVNQEVPGLSKDWMQQADAKAKQRKARLDNINDRLNQMKLQEAALRAGNLKEAAKIGLNKGMEAAKGKAEAGNIKAQGDADAATAILRGAEAQQKDDRAQKDKADALALQREGLYAGNKARADALKAQMAAKGYKADGKGGWEYEPSVMGSSGSGTPKGTPIYTYVRNVDANGKATSSKVKVYQTKESEAYVKSTRREPLRQDLVELSCSKDWAEAYAKISAKDSKYAMYRDAAEALNHSTPSYNDDAVIDAFISTYASTLYNYGAHVFDCTTRGYNEGDEVLPSEDKQTKPASQAVAPETPEQSFDPNAYLYQSKPEAAKETKEESETTGEKLKKGTGLEGLK